jgi:hypothetical protein
MADEPYTLESLRVLLASARKAQQQNIELINRQHPLVRTWSRLQAEALAEPCRRELEAIRELPAIRHFCWLLSGAGEITDQTVQALQDRFHVEHGMPIPEAKQITLADAVELLSRRCVGTVPDHPDAMQPLQTGVSLRQQEGKPIYRFRLDGEIWRIEYGKEHGSFRDARGFEYLAALLKSPNKEIPAIQLTSRGMKPPTEAHSYQPVLDDDSMRACKKRVKELLEVIEDAEEANDVGRAKSARAELESLKDKVKRARGLGGRKRRLGSTADEKARMAVYQALKRAYEKLQGANPPLTALVEHLQRSIRTEGTSYAYRPNPPVPGWEF